MTKLTNFDVLVVYSQSLAKSASDTDSLVPFPLGSRSESYNEVYGYFLNICGQQKIKVAFTTSADIIGPGFCHSFWTIDSLGWHKNNSTCYSNLIFDKFSPTSKGVSRRRQLLFSNPDIKPFNDPGLFSVFFDKQKTFDTLPQHSIPTITLSSPSLVDIDAACLSLTVLTSQHSYSADFGTDIIMKDRFGAGGRRVYKYHSDQSSKMLTKIRKNPRISYIIQPFTIFDKGFKHRDQFSSTDIRLIYLGGKIVQSYIRTAKAGDFRCNEHQGGLLTYLPISRLPKNLIAKSNLIAATLKNQSSLYALDFLISNNGNIHLLEGNTGPGLDWNESIPQNVTQAKKLICLIINELVGRVQNNLSV